MNITKFEDIVAWQESRILIQEIYSVTSSPKFVKNISLKEQIQRVAVSIMSNIAEGFDRNNPTEFIRFLQYSKGSAGELRSLIYVAYDLNYIDINQFELIQNMVISISIEIFDIIKYLKTLTKIKTK